MHNYLDFEKPIAELEGKIEELLFRYRRAGSGTPPGRCAEAMTTLDMDECLGKVFTRADDRRKAYMEAALARQAESPERQAMIRASDKAFEAYRKAECDSVYDNWKEGTIRGSMLLSCSIGMTDARTHVIWENWLTYMDGTPPVLPEPGPTR